MPAPPKNRCLPSKQRRQTSRALLKTLSPEMGLSRIETSPPIVVELVATLEGSFPLPPIGRTGRMWSVGCLALLTRVTLESRSVGNPP